jgi:hypothetical protein
MKEQNRKTNHENTKKHGLTPARLSSLEAQRYRERLDRIYRMNRISKRFGHRCTQMDADLRLKSERQRLREEGVGRLRLWIRAPLGFQAPNSSLDGTNEINTC